MNTRNDNVDYRPIKFIDQMERNKHIVLLYENQKYAYRIIARYFSNGFKKEESCIFFTFESPEAIEERLFAEGIDVGTFKQKKLLSIYNIERSDANKLDTLSTLRQIRQEATKGMKLPYRFVGRTITDTQTVDGMKLGLVLEKTSHDHFDEFNCSQMCYYDISKIESTKRHGWISGLLKNHHYVIYAAESNKAVAFETMLLKDIVYD
jgi:MEDS: MEthanogen/methylotroph, DcmR Sensory domain